MTRGSDVLRRFEGLLADRMTTLQGIAEALGTGTLGPLSDDQQRAVEMLDRSARRLWSDLSDLKRTLAARPDPQDVTTLVRSALDPLTSELAVEHVALQTQLPSVRLHVRTGGQAAAEALQLLARWVLAGTPRGATLQVQVRLAGTRVFVDMIAPHDGNSPEGPAALDVRLGEVQRLLATFGGRLSLERTPSGCSARVTLPAAHH